MPIEPSYLGLERSGELHRRVEALTALERPCRLCPRECRADRATAERGWCGAGLRASLVSRGPHHGEESCLSGWRGSGTIFLGHCNLRCIYCQNSDISQDHETARRHEVADERLADAMLDLQALGCHNINWVSPGHQAAALARALEIAVAAGLRLPIVYNTNAYDSLETLRLLDGVVDIYMPDLKYADEAVAARLSHAPDYVARARDAIREMQRQVGYLQLDDRAIARRGVLLRLLVLPGNLAGVEATLMWIAETLGRAATVNLMSQYHPAHNAASDARLRRPLRSEEYEEALACARRLGLENVLTQPRFARAF